MKINLKSLVAIVKVVAPVVVSLLPVLKPTIAKAKEAAKDANAPKA